MVRRQYARQNSYLSGAGNIDSRLRSGKYIRPCKSRPADTGWDPLNTATLFKPETEAAFFGTAANRTVNDALYLIGTTFTAAEVQITYNGGGV